MQDSDDNYQWIVNEFMSQELPPNFAEYMTDQMMYWVDTNTQQSTWKHPLSRGCSSRDHHRG